MNQVTYTITLYLLSPVIWLYFLYRGLRDRRYWLGLSQRLGSIKRPNGTQCIHIHCASVGETLAAKPLVEQLAIDFPNHSLLITSTTPTGKAEVQKLIARMSGVTIENYYLPIDWLGSNRRFITKTKPCLCILMETELWPNLLQQLRQRKIPILLANARMSEKSLHRYLKHPKLTRQIFKNLSVVAAQYSSDGENFIKAGADKEKIQLIGNLKFEIKISDELLTTQKEFKEIWTAGRPAWIAASIHPAEFKLLLNVHQQLLDSHPELLLIAVPRHPESFEEFKSSCKSKQLTFVSKSENKPLDSSQQILVGDTMGELMTMFPAAEIAFIGGSLIPRGGHNPLEPSVCGLPVIMGPSDYNFTEICQIMRHYRALKTVANADELYDFLNAKLTDLDSLKLMTDSVDKLFNDNRGSAVKISHIAKKLIA